MTKEDFFSIINGTKKAKTNFGEKLEYLTTVQKGLNIPIEYIFKIHYKNGFSGIARGYVSGALHDVDWIFPDNLYVVLDDTI